MRTDNYNPDVLTCLANLSNDEVFTPPAVVNRMLDMLPSELWSNPDARFLDPVSKTGVFLREIAKRLMEGLAEQIPDVQQRANHIFGKQLYGMAITELTALMSRRSVYCSKYANSRYSVCSAFDDEQGNIRYEPTAHTWQNGRCRYCGASQEVYDRGGELESHAYKFIHTDNPKTLYPNMKFDVIIGNPPYQLSDGGNAASARPLYHLFVEQAMKLKPRYLTMIIPARWYAGGKGLDAFRTSMMSNHQIKHLVDFSNSADCFPGVNIAGGVCYFLWEKDYHGECIVTNIKGDITTSSMKRRIDEYTFFVRDNIALSIIRRIRNTSNKTMNTMVKSYSYFAIRSYERGEENSKYKNDVVLLSSNGKGFYPRLQIQDRDGILNKYKVVITYAMSGGNKPSSNGDYQVVSSLQILSPNEVCTETYLVLGVFDTEDEAKKLCGYVKTKLFRFLLLQALSSIHITKESFCFVPIQDYSEEWTDEKLYAKYGLNEEEIAFIESMIRPME